LRFCSFIAFFCRITDELDEKLVIFYHNKR
jgi:hypothetical protein